MIAYIYSGGYTMKKLTYCIIALVILITAWILFLMNTGDKGTPPGEEQNSAIGSKNPAEMPESTTPVLSESSESTQEQVIERFVGDSDRRPIAIMIDNDNSNAWPHAGLEDAYVIYEIIVEGGATRFMALFKDRDTPKIGPIRSSRHYFLDYMLENDAIYVHYGWSPKAAKDILRLKLDKINGVLGSDGWIFWREPKRKYDYHDVYTSIEKIQNISEQKKYRPTSEVMNFSYASEAITLDDGQDAEKITIPYSNYHKTYYEYDSETKLYKRWMRSKPHMLSTTDSQVTAKNIIIQFVKNYYLGDGEPKIGRQELDTVGSGKGLYITNGKAVNITWEKNQRQAKTFYMDENGNEIQLNDGQTWIQITPLGAQVKIE